MVYFCLAVANERRVFVSSNKISVRMNGFVPTDQHLHEILILLFNMKKSATEAYEEIIAAYGEQCIEEATCRDRFVQFAKGDYAFKEGRARSGKKSNGRLKTK